MFNMTNSFSLAAFFHQMYAQSMLMTYANCTSACTPSFLHFTMLLLKQHGSV